MNFDPSYALEFDFSRGQVRMANAGERVLVPSDALLALCHGTNEDEVVRDFGRRLGTEAGRVMNDRLGQAWQASLETVVEHLGGELALMGLGSLGLERWGHALVLSFRPLAARRGRRLLARFSARRRDATQLRPRRDRRQVGARR